MATINIYVSRIGQSTNLSLKQGDSHPGEPGDPDDDSLVTGVNASDTVIWSLDPSPDPGRNTQITLMNVRKKVGPGNPNSQQLLVNDEYSAVAGVITGTVKADPPDPLPAQGPGAKSFEKYQIGFYKNSDTSQTEIWDDPRLRMN